MVFVSDETKDGETVQVRDTKRTIQKNITFILSLDCISNTKTKQSNIFLVFIGSNMFA